MVRLGAIIGLLFSIAAVTGESAGQILRLAGLDEIRVVVESLGKMEDQTGLKQTDVTIHSASPPVEFPWDSSISSRSYVSSENLAKERNKKGVKGNDQYVIC